MEWPSLSLSRRRLLAGAAALAAVLVLGLRHFQAGGRPAAPAVAPVRVAKPAPVKQVVVDVVGAVRRPGLYRLRDGTRIADAVRRAGGATAQAELALVNLAAPLADGEQIVVPERSAHGAAAAAPGAAQAGASPGAPLDLNTATEAQLESLPGIGPATAAKILAYRVRHGAFHSVEEDETQRASSPCLRTQSAALGRSACTVVSAGSSPRS